ncbi:MAG: hypothetical protein P4M00_11755 [Azospirillaceae bacterium]|nr:hypothetical protein [Azospirillaceae bacterium]
MPASARPPDLILPDLILLEFLLRSTVGHTVNYHAAIQRAARQRGLSVRLFCQRSAPVDTVAVLGADPLFQVDYRALERIENTRVRLHTSNMALLDDLQSLEPLLSPRTTIFVQQITNYEALGLAQWYALRPDDRRPRLVICLRAYVERLLETPFGVAVAALMQFGSAVRLCTDTAQLADHFARELTRRPDVIPIPHVSHPLMLSEVPALLAAALDRIRNRADVMVLGLYLGVVGAHKGFLQLHDIITAVRAAGLPVRFIVQARLEPHSIGDPVALEAQIRRLQADPGTDLLLIEEELGEAAYGAVLDACDILLMPYISAAYRHNSSGIFAEAIAAGKIVIVPRDSWMGSELTRFGAAGVALPDITPVDIAQAVGAIVADRVGLQQRAREAVQAWTAFHNAGTLVEYLMAAGGAPSSPL